MDLLVVGSVAFDDIKTPFGEQKDILAGAATYFSIASSFFTPTGVVGVVGDDFTAEHETIFRSRNIDLTHLERIAGGKSFRWGGEYNYDFNTRTTLFTHLNVFADFQPKLSPAACETPYLFLGNIHPDLQRSVRDQVKAKLTAMDTMNFWISGTLESLLETLRGIDLLIINDEEARQLAGQSNIIRAAKTILDMGPKRLIVKRGEYGAALFGEEEYFAMPAFPQDEVVDPTGAGDSFAGGVLGYLAATGGDIEDASAMRRAMIYGSVLASFTIESFGTERLLQLSHEEINARFTQFKYITHFEDVVHAF